MNEMEKLVEFLAKHCACSEGKKWATVNCKSLTELWEKLVAKQAGDVSGEWLLWVATSPGVFDDKKLRLLACRFVRETPLSDGRRVWDLLGDKRSRNAVTCVERFARGEASRDELAAASAAAMDAAWDAASASSQDAAWNAISRMIAEEGNPFRRRKQ